MSVPGGLTAIMLGSGGSSAMQVLSTLGLTTGLKFCLDAGDASSYTNGASWLDTSGNGCDFFIGQTGSVEASDPTFNGTPGGLSSSEYFGLDGGDYFKYDTTNETWMQNLHKNNAVFSFLAAFYYITSGSAQGILGTDGNKDTNTGIQFSSDTSNRMRCRVSNGTGSYAVTESGGELDTSAWNIVGFSADEGANTSRFVVNGASAIPDTWTYTSPSSSDATYTMELSSLGNAQNRPVNGSRIAVVAVWEGTALSANNFASIYSELRGRFGI